MIHTESPTTITMISAVNRKVRVLAFAVVQIVVHLKYFLHLTMTDEEGKANTLTFLFTALIIVMVVGLSVWIIYASNAMMMH